jgi:hypothetical protein
MGLGSVSLPCRGFEWSASMEPKRSGEQKRRLASKFIPLFRQLAARSSDQIMVNKLDFKMRQSAILVAMAVMSLWQIIILFQ